MDYNFMGAIFFLPSKYFVHALHLELRLIFTWIELKRIYALKLH